MNMGNFIFSKSSKTANASNSTGEKSQESTNAGGNRNNSTPRRNSEPVNPKTTREFNKSQEKTSTGSVSDTNNKDGIEDDSRNKRTLDPNTKRNGGYKRKLAESSDSSDDDEESLRNHRKGTEKKQPNLKKHQVPQPKLPKIITHKNNKEYE